MNLSNPSNIFQTPIAEKLDNERLLNVALATELEENIKILAQIRINKTLLKQSGPFSLNVEYYSGKTFKKIDHNELPLQNIETGEKHRRWNLYKIIWNLKNFLVIPEQLEETENKNDTNPNLARAFYSTGFINQPYGKSFFILNGCGSAFGKSMSISKSLIAGPFDDILSWLFEGTNRIKIFRQNDSSILWTNLLKTGDKTTPCFSQSSTLQPNPGFVIFLYLPHDEMFQNT